MNSNYNVYKRHNRNYELLWLKKNLINYKKRQKHVYTHKITVNI